MRSVLAVWRRLRLYLNPHKHAPEILRYRRVLVAMRLKTGASCGWLRSSGFEGALVCSTP